MLQQFEKMKLYGGKNLAMSLLSALPFCLPLSGLTWWYCLNENFNIKDWYWYTAVMVFFFVSVQCVICQDLR